MLTVNDQTPDIMKHYWFIFQGDMLLLETTAHDTYRVPCADMPPVDPSPDTTIHDIGLLDDIGVKAFATTAHEPQPGFEFMPLRASYNHLPLAHYLKAGKCREIIHWDNGTRYCGACGTPLEPMTEISKRCPKCGREAWPQLNIAVIVLIRKADEVLLVQAKNFRRNYFGLVAGFVETGETLEQAVQREVMEETRLTITNLKYFASQPWPYPCNLMVGFTADYAGGEVALQSEELSKGGWFTKDNLPQIPEKLSIARKLIDSWIEQQQNPTPIRHETGH